MQSSGEQFGCWVAAGCQRQSLHITPISQLKAEGPLQSPHVTTTTCLNEAGFKTHDEGIGIVVTEVWDKRKTLKSKSETM